MAWLVLRRILDVKAESKEVLAALWPLLLFTLGTNQGVALALERGQSDIFSALLCWSAVLVWLRGGRFLPVFLAVWTTLLKGYSVLFAAGLVLLGLADLRSRRATIGGATTALVVMLAPVTRYLPEAKVATTFRANMFWHTWINHSFKNLAYNISPAVADAGRLFLGGVALAGTAAAWWALWRAFRADAAGSTTTLWLVLFASASLATMLGVSALSCSYNLILVLPGALLITLAQRRLLRLAPMGSDSFVGTLLCLLCFVLFVFRIGSPFVSPAAFGLLGLPMLAGTAALASSRVRDGRRNGQDASIVGPASRAG